MYSFQKKIFRPLEIILITIFFSCQNKELPFIKANLKCNCRELKLGDSNYHLKIPVGFEISEALGKEGQIGYSILPKDSSSGMYGFVEIEPGHYSISDRSSEEGSRNYVQSDLLNKKVTWKIYRTESMYFEANTKNKNISASVSSKNKNEIDSLIAIIATLIERKEF